jgi:type II secretory pathway component PulK
MNNKSVVIKDWRNVYDFWKTNIHRAEIDSYDLVGTSSVYSRWVQSTYGMITSYNRKYLGTATFEISDESKFALFMLQFPESIGNIISYE